MSDNEQTNMERPPQKHMGPPNGAKHGGPPKRRMGPPGGPSKRRMGPPGGRPGGPPIFSKDDILIMPDFRKWRDVFMRLDVLFIFTALLFELIFFGLASWAGTLSMSPVEYIVQHIIIPTGINIILLIIATVIRRRLPKDNTEMRQNFLPIIVMYLTCLVITVSHCSLTMTLCIYTIPIFMTTIFTNTQICKLSSVMCFIGAVIASTRNFIMTDGTIERIRVVFQSLILILILIVCMLVALALLGMTNGQREKLLNFTNNIREEQRKAEAANIAKSTFLANMSHEIRTPINAILGMDEMILRESSERQITEYAENIYSASTSLLYLINDVLDISKIESGKLEIVEINYDTSSLIHDCCNMINEKVSKKSLEFKIFCNPNLPAQLYGDEVHLRQIITNLLSNAAKYTSQGCITLSIDGQKEGDRIMITISVKDTGMGIKEENLKTLFSQFTRFDMDKNRNIEGTGLGLSITKQLVELMNGTISVESTYGEGSTFTVVLPQKIISDTPMGNFQDHYQAINQKNASYHQSFEAPDAKILVVDDVIVNLKVATNLLKKTKMFVDTANSGKMCLNKITQNKYDIIFMDHMMPEMSGIETFQTMQKMPESLNKDTPVIMLTANAISGVKEEYISLGFADYLSKPILGDKFEKMILKYLPEDKITNINVEDLINTPPVAAESAEDISAQKKGLKLLQNFYQEYPKINVGEGLMHFGQSTDIYISVLHAYCERIDPEPVIACFEQQNMHRYEVLTHDIKRFSADNGLQSLANQAADLEAAAIREDWDFIKDNHIAFIMECQNVINAVKNTLDRRKT